MIYIVNNESTRKTRLEKANATAGPRIRGQYRWHKKTKAQYINPYRYFGTRKTQTTPEVNQGKDSKPLFTTLSTKMFVPLQFVYRYFQSCVKRRVRPGPDGESFTDIERH